ncbi:MAG: DUF424 family protein [Candidatus Hodarchaeota archaeon]
MTDKVYLKIHRSGASEVIAICDPPLIGKHIRGSCHKLFISERFYLGMLVSKEEALNYIQKASNVNLVGTIVSTLLERKWLNENAVLWLDDEELGQKIPHVIIFRP